MKQGTKCHIQIKSCSNIKDDESNIYKCVQILEKGKDIERKPVEAGIGSP